MGEIDTKPIESVQTVLSFFGQSQDQKNNSPIKDEQQEVKREREVESLEKELANVKVQNEAKENAYKQALIMIDHLRKTADELTTLLKNSDRQKDFYINESQEAKTRVNQLQSALERMAYQLSESEKVQEQLLHVTNDLESTQCQLMNIETELTILREAKMESLSRIQAMENALDEEKLQKEDLLRQLETMQDLENQVMEKSAHIDSLQLELKQVHELHISSEEVASDAISELNKLKEEMELQEKKNRDQAGYIHLLEMELKQLRIELGNANADAENVKMELEKRKEGEKDAQVELALLKFELHKGRSKLAAAEAAETRAQSEKSALYNALQQMGLEAEEMKKENKLLKEFMKSADESHENYQLVVHSQVEETDQEHEEDAISGGKDEDLIEKAEEEKQIHDDHLNEDGKELENVKKELEVAMSKIGELRTRAEQAISRAEAAEKTKGALEDKIKRRKEQKERRKAALAALREESISRDDGSIKYDTSAKNYQPLGKVLNMKF